MTLDKIKGHLDDCVPLMNKLNHCLPEEHRLEYLSLRHGTSPTPIPPPAEHTRLSQDTEDRDDEETESDNSNNNY